MTQMSNTGYQGEFKYVANQHYQEERGEIYFTN